jgi:aspartate kinase
MKFGGTSLGDACAIASACCITAAARREYPRLVLVASAMAGITNLLLDAAAAALQGRLDAARAAAAEIRDRHYGAARALLPDAACAMQLQAEIEPLIAAFSRLCRAVRTLGELTPRASDAIACLGERMSVRLLAVALCAAGLPARAVDATRLIVTDDRFQNAHPDFAATRRKTQYALAPIFAAGEIPVVTGFIAATPQGAVTTLGRGGSDYSAALLGAALAAQDVWIWTDVDGVMTADPRLVPQARTIPCLTFKEAGELACFGAKVLHPKTIRPLIEAGIGLRVCNTFNPDCPGTRVTASGQPPKNGSVLKAVTSIHRQRIITIAGRGMPGVPGVAARAFAAVAGTQAGVTLISQASSGQGMILTVPAASAAAIVCALESAFSAEPARRDIDCLRAGGEAAIVTAVGAGIRDTPGAAGALLSALADAGVNVIAIAQGVSDAAMSVVVLERDAAPALRAIHALIS